MSASPQEPSKMAKSPGLPPVVERLEKGQKTPICVIVVGMAGAGKSSLMAQMQYHAANKSKEEMEKKQKMQEKDQHDEANNVEAAADNETVETLPTYCINLDPATHHLSYGAAIDIRDTINYKEGNCCFDIARPAVALAPCSQT
jgi:ribose 1,5-bisphosphokinase PhnN